MTFLDWPKNFLPKKVTDRKSDVQSERAEGTCAHTGDSFYTDGELQPQAKSRTSLHSTQQQDKA